MAPDDRTASLRRLIDAAGAAILAAPAATPAITAAAGRIFSALGAMTVAPAEPGACLPVCANLLPAIATARSGPPAIARIADALERLSTHLIWRRSDRDGDPRFAAGHANAQIVGTDGLAQCDGVRLGMSLVAPGITYPDHHHPPEEIYIILSPGEWRQNAAPWHAPGIGGLVYNPPDILHAMRAGATPLLAMWCLGAGTR